MIYVEFFRSLIRETKLLLLSRLTKRLLLNKTLIMNILLYYNYLLNKKMRE